MNQTITISPLTNVEELAIFLAQINADSTRHVGYCGEDKGEIIQTLHHNFSDLQLSESFAVAYKNGEIIGALGLDIDKEDRSAEVWGPFISKGNDGKGLDEELWKQAITYSGMQFNKVSFFLNKDNRNGREFVSKLGGIEKERDFILKIGRKEFSGSSIEEFTKYEAPYKKSFSALHEMAFPNTYYSAEEIVSDLSSYNRLFIIKSNGKEIKGYVHLKANQEHGEGSIEYIAVATTFRNQGIGMKLIQTALGHLFSYKGIETVTISVDKENRNAFRLYQMAGFKVQHELVFSELMKPTII